MNSAIIKVKILPGLSEFFGAGEAKSIVLEEKIEEGATVGDILGKLANEHQAFGAVVFDAGTHKMSGYATIALNDRLVESLNGLGTFVRAGDVIMLFPVIAGG